MANTPDEPPVAPNGQQLDMDDWRAVRDQAKASTYFMGKAILGYDKIARNTHLNFSNFVQDREVRNKVALMPRSHLKTTVATITDTIREIAVDPNIRILIGNETHANSKLMLREIRNHFQSNETFRSFFPELIPPNFNKTVWSDAEILIPRTAMWREPTVSTIGTGGAVVSRHFNLLKLDDLVGESALKSPTEMADAIHWLNGVFSLLVNSHEDRIHLIGTRWNTKDVYSHAIEKMGFKVFRRKALVLGEHGPEPFFPEMVSMEMLETIMRTDPFKWATQYSNDPYDINDNNLERDWLQFFTIGPDGDFRFNRSDGSLGHQDRNRLRWYLHVDPSMGERETSDSTAFVLVALSEDGLIFVFDAWKQRIDPIKTLDHLFEYQEKYAPFITTIEGVAYQKALKYFAEERARRKGLYLKIEDFHPGNQRKKNDRILYTLQPYFRDRKIYVRSGLFQFVDEYNLFGRDHPDILDALSQGPSVWKYPVSFRAMQRRRKLYESYERKGSTGYGI